MRTFRPAFTPWTMNGRLVGLALTPKVVQAAVAVVGVEADTVEDASVVDGSDAVEDADANVEADGELASPVRNVSRRMQR